MQQQEFFNAIQAAYHIEDEQNVNKLNLLSIKEITDTALIYENANGKTESIMLSVCASNFAAVNGQMTNSSGQRLKCVGGRFYSNSLAFYEFFALPHVRFCMANKHVRFKRFMLKLGFNLDAKRFSSFYLIQKKLNSHGYTTIDLT